MHELAFGYGHKERKDASPVDLVGVVNGNVRMRLS